MGKKHRKQAGADVIGSPSVLMDQGKHEQAKRRFSEAERLFRRALEIAPTDPGPLDCLGILYFEWGRREKAIETMEKVAKANPGRLESTINLGVAYQMTGDLDRALAVFEEAAQNHPDNPVPLVNRGFVLSLKGRHGDAIRCYQHALAVDPKIPDAYFHLGNSLRESGRQEDAIVAFRKAIEINPRNPDAYNNLGTILLDAGRYHEAVAALERAISLSRAPAIPLGNLASAMRLLGRFPEATGHATRALQLQPSLATARVTLGGILRETGASDRAEEEFRKAQKLAPGLLEARTSLAKLLMQQGKVEECVEVLRSSPQPDPGLRVLEALVLPVIPKDRAEIAAWRAHLVESVDALRDEGLKLQDPMAQVGTTTFHLAYGAASDRKPQEHVARFSLAAAPELGWTAPHCASPASPNGRKIKVGIASAFLRSHTIGKLYGRLVGELGGDEIDTVLFQAPGVDDEMARSIASSVGKAVRLSPKLQTAREQIAAEELDALFYPEIGMDAFIYYLAYSRLAPVQCVTWGHPMTTGSPSMDYFISSKDLEVEDGDKDYTERLIRMPDLTTVFTRPATPDPPKSREAFGLPADAKLYACLQTLFKFHPDFDDAIAELLRRDPKGLLVLITGRERHWDELVQARFRRNHPDIAEQMVFMPGMPLDEFLSLTMISDALLDTFHFGGGNTSMEGFAVGSPVVTLPGTQLRNRITLACYRKMGMLDLVAGDASHYVDLCYRLANDFEFQRQMRQKTLDTCAVLFDNHAATDQMKQFLVDAAGAAARGEKL